MLGFLSQLAQLLVVTPASLHQRLAANALHDPSPGVRLRNLEFLVWGSNTPKSLLAETARALLADVRDEVRLLAAKQLGEEGASVLAELASDPQAEAALRLEALRALEPSGDKPHERRSPP